MFVSKIVLFSMLTSVGGCASLGDLVDKYFLEEDRELMLRISWCESSSLPEDTYSLAVNPSSKATGFFQQHPKFWEERTEKYFDGKFAGMTSLMPEANVAIASALYYELDSHPRWSGASHWYPSWRCWEDWQTQEKE